MRDLVGFKHGAIMHPYTTAMLANMRKQSLAAHKGTLMILNIVWQWDVEPYLSFGEKVASRVHDEVSRPSV